MPVRLWLWSEPLPTSVEAELESADTPRLAPETEPGEVLDRAASGGESLWAAAPERIAELLVLALELPAEGAEALQLEGGRGASLVRGPLGWELERFGVAGTGPHLAARR